MLSIEFLVDFINLHLVEHLFFIFFGYFAYWLSSKADSFPFRTLFVYIGIHILFSEYTHKEDMLVKNNLYIVLACIVPHIKYFFYLTIKIYFNIKMMFANTYYFLITIYYKIIRLINWIVSFFIILKTFFTTFSFKKEDYEKEQNTYQKYNDEEKTEKKSYQKSYQKEKAKSYTKQDKTNDEFLRFFSKDPYIVLGVSQTATFSEIKKVYRSLIMEFHPDKNANRLEICTEITKSLNNSYDILKRRHR